jgi:Cdc6-like AAA superfamily ATPase
MLISLLRDGAIAAAKGYHHAEVEPRHVWYAAVRHLRNRPEIEALLPAAKAGLEPRGSALTLPNPTAEAEQTLRELAESGDLAAALLTHFGTGNSTNPNPARSPDPIPSEAKPAAVPAPNQPARESITAVLAELDQLIGLESVKRQVATVAAVVQANLERTKAGKAAVAPGLHLVFTGAPGTGKTTVARLVARLYAAAGALPGANFTEVGRADLVAGYVGQTAIKTSDVIAKTRPGVLFIDEAYALTPSHGSDFGAEAIATLVKAMEDHRGELAVIAAGYSEEMTAFVESNPGLKSRFKTFIAFPDFSPDELTTIFASFASQSGIALEEGVLPVATGIFRKAIESRDFGNARFARSLFEQAYARMASRAASDGSVQLEEVSTITIADIPPADGDGRGPRRIGFGRS